MGAVPCSQPHQPPSFCGKFLGWLDVWMTSPGATGSADFDGMAEWQQSESRLAGQAIKLRAALVLPQGSKCHDLGSELEQFLWLEPPFPHILGWLGSGGTVLMNLSWEARYWQEGFPEVVGSTAIFNMAPGIVLSWALEGSPCHLQSVGSWTGWRHMGGAQTFQVWLYWVWWGHCFVELKETSLSTPIPLWNLQPVNWKCLW